MSLQCALYKLNYKAYIPVCNSKSQRDCIEEFWFTLNGKRYKPSLDSYMPAQTIYQFPADSAANLPEGKSTSIWQLTDPDFKNEKQIYAVSAVFTSGTASRSKNFLVPNISVVIDKVHCA